MTLLFRHTLGKSLIYKMNKIGPETDSRRSPRLINSVSDYFFSPSQVDFLLSNRISKILILVFSARIYTVWDFKFKFLILELIAK